METIALVDSRRAGYGFRLHLQSETLPRHKDFINTYQTVTEKYGVKVWEKFNPEFTSIEFLTENQDAILSICMEIAEAMGLSLDLL